jgi:hypothetical protein
MPRKGWNRFLSSHILNCGVEKSANLPGTNVPDCH